MILSFLGGIRWGSLVSKYPTISPSWGQFSISVMPSLVAWAALISPNIGNWNFIIIMFGLYTIGYLDIKQSPYLPWFKNLRILLTTVAILSLSSTLIFQYCLEHSDISSLDQFLVEKLKPKIEN